MEIDCISPDEVEILLEWINSNSTPELPLCECKRTPSNNGKWCSENLIRC